MTLVGKGVTFDSGGLDIKPAAGMRLMKKDMGGAAVALGVARLVMGARLPVRLRLIVPAVENAIAGNAFRPGDVLRTRAGMTVEIGNTDAEGRLILADALTLAQEDAPDLLLDFATLTGAARVALGPDLPALYSHDDALAADLLAAGTAAGDPLWRLPLWAPYAEMLKSAVADHRQFGRGRLRRLDHRGAVPRPVRRCRPGLGPPRPVRVEPDGAPRAAEGRRGDGPGVPPGACSGTRFAATAR